MILGILKRTCIVLIYILLIVPILNCGSSSDQSKFGKIAGKVNDCGNHPLLSGTVVLDVRNDTLPYDYPFQYMIGTVSRFIYINTDSVGNFKKDSIPIGYYTVTVHGNGYDRDSDADSIKMGDVFVKSVAIPLYVCKSIVFESVRIAPDSVSILDVDLPIDKIMGFDPTRMGVIPRSRWFEEIVLDSSL